MVDLQAILDCPMGDNDANATTVKGYLVELLAVLWREEEAFSSKRPFGNSGWAYDVYKPLIEAGLVPGTLDEDGYVDECDPALIDQQYVIPAIRLIGMKP